MKLTTIACFSAILLASTYVVAEDAATKSGNSKTDSPLVTLKQGQLQGLTYRSRKGQKYYGFLGVPYGKSAVRFGVPEAPDSWTGIKKATKFPPHCLQFCLIQQRIVGTEDCLALNVYTPKLNGKAPVMVLLHGGGFQFGSGNLQEAKYLMDEEVILVTVQYRLGALGFLNTGDGVVPGNMGLKDQSAALKWLQDNIEKFGGDPKKVTIFGFSAGGASVHYQMLSPMSKGLFSRAISQSGSALNPWAFQKNPTQIFERLIENVGCKRETSDQAVECLRNKPASDIITGQLKLSVFPHEFDLISMLFCPSVDSGKSEPKFLPDTPYKLIESDNVASKVPWIIGVTKDEGAMYIAQIVENKKSIELINKDFDKMAANILYYEDSANPSTQRRITEKAWEFYFGDDGKITSEGHLQLGRLYGDRFFVTGVSRAIREHAKKASFPIYPYIFNHEGEHSIVQGFLYSKNTYGVSHADDLKYLFNRTYGAPEYTLDTDEGKFSEKLIQLYVSFAKDGKPASTLGPKWEPLAQGDIETVPWYEIDTKAKVLEEDPFKERVKFWESLPLKELEKEDYPDEKDEL